MPNLHKTCLVHTLNAGHDSAADPKIARKRITKQCLQHITAAYDSMLRHQSEQRKVWRCAPTQSPTTGRSEDNGAGQPGESDALRCLSRAMRGRWSLVDPTAIPHT